MGARGSRSAAAAAGPRPAPAVVVLLAMDEKRKSCWSCDWISLWLNLRRRLLRGAGGGPRWSECVAIPRSVLQPSLGSCFSLKLVAVVGGRDLGERESDELLLISSLDPADPSCDSQRARAHAGLATRRRLLGLGRVGVDSASRPPALSLRPTLVHLGSSSCRCRST